MQLEGTWGINFPLIINDLRPQKTTSSKEVAQCQAQALAKCLVWSSTPGWQRTPVPRKNPTLPHQGLVWQCRVTRRCRGRGWFGVASLLCPDLSWDFRNTKNIFHDTIN